MTSVSPVAIFIIFVVISSSSHHSHKNHLEMGPKGKPNPTKGKNPTKTESEINPDEVVTELQKEFFEFQLSEIEKKINRIDDREEELKAGTIELEEKIEEFKKEKGAIIAEHEQLLATKEEEKVQKREEMCRLSDEIKIRIEKHKKHIEEMEKKFNKMVTDMTEQLEELEEEVRILEDYKQNKDLYTGKIDELEAQMEETKMQHQRNLFEIERKWEMAKGRVKKELQSRLLQLSIDFQQTTQKKIGKPCHRATQENKAIQNALLQMQEEIFEYHEKRSCAEKNMNVYKSQKDKKQQEKDKTIARTLIQQYVIKTLLKDRVKLWEKIKTFEEVDNENKNLVKKYKMVSNEIEKKTNTIEEIRQNIEDKMEENTVMKEATKHLKKSLMRLQVLIRNALKIAEEAIAVRLIPLGGLEEERNMTTEAKIRLFKIRRDMTFQKRGRILQYLFEFLSKGQLTEDDKKLLKSSSESIDIENINFSMIYGKAILAGDKELEAKESLLEAEEEKKGPIFFTSLTSLPRSVSTLIIAQKQESETESYFGEFEEYGEGDEEGEEPPKIDLEERAVTGAEEKTTEEKDGTALEEKEVEEPTKEQEDGNEEERKSQGSTTN